MIVKKKGQKREYSGDHEDKAENFVLGADTLHVEDEEEKDGGDE